LTAQAPIFFTCPEDFRAWLAAQGGTATELAVGFHRVATGRPSLTWPEAVAEALCAGWIDGVRRGLDDTSYQIRFTPRRPGSIWSAVNIATAERLQAEGRLQPAGLEAFARRVERKSRVYSYEQEGGPALAEAELKLFGTDKAAWATFESLPPGYRRTLLHWITSAKQAPARARRLAKFLAACAAGVRLLP
jgi:uncharacterized protein YdeI (YjbR/CyaY-like superfamily)